MTYLSSTRMSVTKYSKIYWLWTFPGTACMQLLILSSTSIYIWIVCIWIYQKSHRQELVALDVLDLEQHIVDYNVNMKHEIQLIRLIKLGRETKFKFNDSCNWWKYWDYFDNLDTGWIQLFLGLQSKRAMKGAGSSRWWQNPSARGVSPNAQMWNAMCQVKLWKMKSDDVHLTLEIV